MIQKYFIVEFSAGCCCSVDNVDIRVLVLVDNIEMCMGRILITLISISMITVSLTDAGQCTLHNDKLNQFFDMRLFI